jgi:16S rRNA (uracil1498-N3)-methyltransferase
VTVSVFLVDALPAGDTYRLDGPEGHHAATVQRLRIGQSLLLTDGRGSAVSASVLAVGRGFLDLSLGARSRSVPPDPRLVVVQGIAKGDRGELAVQAMTEAGVDEIVPWAAARSVAKWRDGKPLERWRSTVREAAKQARRCWLPVVSAPLSTAEVAARLSGAAAALVLHETAPARLSTVDLPASGAVVVVVGPEGGVADDELAAFVAAGAVPVRLGEPILRTSTAGVAALSALSVRLGRW